MKEQELLNIRGGGIISGTFLNAIAKSINSILELGRSLGSAVRRLFDKKLCSY